MNLNRQDLYVGNGNCIDVSDGEDNCEVLGVLGGLAVKKRLLADIKAAIAHPWDNSLILPVPYSIIIILLLLSIPYSTEHDMTLSCSVL